VFVFLLVVLLVCTTCETQEGQIISVPQGSIELLDGTLGENEWGEAEHIQMNNGDDIYLMSDGDYLYLGIRSYESLVGSICIADDEKISILHSSAALGSAIYHKEGENWRRVQNYNWQMREADMDEETQQARSDYLANNGWIASIGYMGNGEEVEYQIEMPEDGLRFAVAYLVYGGKLYWWPQELEDDCHNNQLISGTPPTLLSFSPENWVLAVPFWEE
jgi:hypothetical protein